MWDKYLLWSFGMVLLCEVAVIAEDEAREETDTSYKPVNISTLPSGTLHNCSSCVHRDKCMYFGQMTRTEQDRWLEKFSCKPTGSLADDEASLFGFSPIAKGDFVCCVDFGNIQGNKSNDNDKNSANINQTQNPDNRNKNNHDDVGFESDPNRRPISFNYNTRPKQSRPIQNNQKPWNNQPQNQNSWSNQRPGQISWGNQRPGQNSWGNQRPSQTTWNNQRPNNYQTPNQNSWNNQRPLVNQNPNQFIQFPNNGRTPNDRSDSFGGPPGNFGGNSGNNGGNTGGNFGGNAGNFNANSGGQCSRITSLPPSPETGCCGRDPSDADRITDDSPRSTSKFNPRPWTPEDSLPKDQEDSTSLFNLPSWLQSALPFKEKVKRAAGQKVNVTLDNRIAGGKMTEIDQFPWTVLLKTTFNYGDKESAFACGGSLISSKYVLTAAHCLKDEEGTVSDVEITLAEFDKRTFPRDCVVVPGEGRRCIDNVVMHAEDIITHPQYDDSRLQNDIALIRLKGNAPYTEFIRPICLPPIDIDKPDFSDLPVTVAGWGRNGQYSSDVKQSTVVNLVPQRQCKSSYPFLTRRHLCAAGYTGEDTCKGDSGGPLMILYEGKYFVSGVVSGKRADSPCGTSVPSLYTNVYQYLDWIMKNIR